MRSIIESKDCHEEVTALYIFCKTQRAGARDLVDGDGSCVFGTFQDEFETMDLVSAKKPASLAQLIFGVSSFTLWLDDGGLSE